MAIIGEPDCSSLERFKRQVGTRLGFESASIERLELSCKGKPLLDDDDIDSLEEEDTVLCFLKPKKYAEIRQSPPSSNEDNAIEDEVDNLFSWNEQSPVWLKDLLINRCGIPEWLVGPVTHITGKQWMIFSAWMIGSKLASRWDLGPIYLLGTLFYVMFRNLGKRTGEFSAYSIFNRGARRLNGQLDSAQLQQQLGYL